MLKECKNPKPFESLSINEKVGLREGTLMQIWKSPLCLCLYMLVRKVCKFLKK